MRLAPGGPFDEEQALPPEIKANLEAAYGLDQPLSTQYGRYVQGLLHGDFGPSFRYRDFTRQRAHCAGTARQPDARACRAVLLATAGRSAARHPGGLAAEGAADHRVRTIAVLGIAMPSFVIGPLLALVFGIHLQLAAGGGLGGGDLRYTGAAGDDTGTCR